MLTNIIGISTSPYTEKYSFPQIHTTLQRRQKSHETTNATAISLNIDNGLSSPSSVPSSPSVENDTQITPPVTTIQSKKQVEGVCDLSDITINTNMTIHEAKLHISLLQRKIEQVIEKKDLYKSHNKDLNSKLEIAHKHLEQTKDMKSVGKNLFTKRKWPAEEITKKRHDEYNLRQ